MPYTASGQWYPGAANAKLGQAAKPGQISTGAARGTTGGRGYGDYMTQRYGISGPTDPTARAANAAADIAEQTAAGTYRAPMSQLEQAQVGLQTAAQREAERAAQAGERQSASELAERARAAQANELLGTNTLGETTRSNKAGETLATRTQEFREGSERQRREMLQGVLAAIQGGGSPIQPIDPYGPGPSGGRLGGTAPTVGPVGAPGASGAFAPEGAGDGGPVRAIKGQTFDGNPVGTGLWADLGERTAGIGGGGGGAGVPGAGAPAGTGTPGAPGSGAPDNPYDLAAESAIYGRAKERTGRAAQSALKGLREQMAARGIGGSGIEAANTRGVFEGALGEQAETERQMAQGRADKAFQAEGENKRMRENQRQFNLTFSQNEQQRIANQRAQMLQSLIAAAGLY